MSTQSKNQLQSFDELVTAARDLEKSGMSHNYFKRDYLWVWPALVSAGALGYLLGLLWQTITKF